MRAHCASTSGSNVPIRTYTDTGALILDSDALTLGMCIGSLTVASGATLTKAYPSLAGCEVRAFFADGFGEALRADPSAVAITYPGSIPTITVSSAHYGLTIIVWCVGTPSTPPATGIYAATPSGGVCIALEAFGFNFIGTASVLSTTASWGSPNADGELGGHTLYFDWPAPIVPIIVAPDGEYVACWGLRKGSGDRWLIDATRTASRWVPGDSSWPALSVPTVKVYGAPASFPGPPAFAIWPAGAADGTPPAWDLMKANLLHPHALPALYDDTSTEAFSAASSVGVFGAGMTTAIEYVGDPGFPLPESYMAGRRRYRSMWRRVGNSIQCPLACTSASAPESTNPFDVGLVKTFRTAQPILVDLTGL